jgi:hypothetical protein
MDTYKRIQAITVVAARRKAIKSLSDPETKAYTNYQANLRKKKFMFDANNRDRVYADNNDRKAQFSKTNPERARALVREYVCSLLRTVAH